MSCDFMAGGLPGDYPQNQGISLLAISVTHQKIEALRRYAQADAKAKGILVPSINGLSPEEAAVSLCRFMSESNQYLPGDINFDNQKRNLTIRLFLEYPIDALRQYGCQWLDRWRDRDGSCLWFQEWDRILRSGSDEDVVRILLSSDEESTRQRLSKPFSGLLDQEVVFKIKHSGVAI